MVPFASPFDLEGIDCSSVRVSLGGEVTFDVMMIRVGKQLHRGFERELLRSLVEDNDVQHEFVQVVRDIAGECFQVRLRIVVMLIH